MAQINMKSIMSKVKSYSKTQECKNRMDEYIETCRRDGRATTAAGDDVITFDAMIRAARELKNTVENIANAYRLPDSVNAAVNSLAIGGLKYMASDKTAMIELNLTADLTRMSLEPDKYDGVDNIVALFNNGYDSPNSKYVFGLWHGNWTWGKTHRDALKFMQAACDDFNTKWGKFYNCFATIDSIYGN